MPAAKLSPDAWNEVRQASEAGCLDDELAEKYNVSRESIRKRRQLDGWKTPAKAAAEEAMQAQYRKLRVSNGGTVSQVSRGAETTAQILAERGEIGSLRATELLLALLQRADLERIKPISHVSDVSTAVTALRKVAGLDKPEAAVQVNLAMFSQKTGPSWVPDVTDNEGVAEDSPDHVTEV